MAEENPYAVGAELPPAPEEATGPPVAGNDIISVCASAFAAGFLLAMAVTWNILVAPKPPLPLAVRVGVYVTMGNAALMLSITYQKARRSRR